MSGFLRRVTLSRFSFHLRKMSAVTEVALAAVEETQQEIVKQGRKRKHSDEETEDVPDVTETQTNGVFPLQQSEYYFQNGYRKVYPYSFQYTTHAKGRWIGRTIMDVFSTEFRARPKEYYARAIETGQIKMGGKPITQGYRIKNGDFMTNDSHRHEVPVLGCPIKIIHEDENMLIVDKPPSIPVHPCGRYRLNSIVGILNRELGYKDLHTLHRLDRMTSGVLMLAKTKERAVYMDKLIKEHSLEKQYLCRVEGEFPDGEIVVDKPIEVWSYKIGLCGVSDNGRDATTVFEKLSYNGKSSVVRAKPKHGRMHQIRVHLQYLGHPILNDPLYNDEIFGSDKAKGGLTQKTSSQLVEEMMQRQSVEIWISPMSDAEVAERLKAIENSKQDFDRLEKAVSTSTEDFFKHYPKSLEHYITDDFRKTVVGYDPRKMQHVDSCPECKISYVDPPPEKLVMYLHCLTYKGGDFEYAATWPNWAKETWELD